MIYERKKYTLIWQKFRMLFVKIFDGFFFQLNLKSKNKKFSQIKICLMPIIIYKKNLLYIDHLKIFLTVAI